jgi:hypothetical protein
MPAAPPATPAPAQSASPADEQTDLGRIKTALSKPSVLKKDDAHPKFYLEVRAKQPSLADFIHPGDLTAGPVKGTLMTGQEFLASVTPKQLYSNGGGFTASEMLQSAIFNLAAQTGLKKVAQGIHDAWTERQIRAIRAQIDRELAALRGGGY